jgi:hypothetical protein
MSISLGSILIGIAFSIVVAAYLARPFRPAQSVDFDRATEIWVTQARAAHGLPAEDVGSPPPPVGAEEPVNFCSKCGRRVTPEDHFCPGCGKSLRGGV